MTTRTYAPSLSLSMATCLGYRRFRLAVYPLPTLALRRLMTSLPPQGSTLSPSTWGPGVDVFTSLVYHLTWMDTQLSKFWRSRVTATHNHLTLAAHPPCHWHGFERTGRTKRMEPSSVQSASGLPAGGSSAAPLARQAKLDASEGVKVPFG
jgi:hypothetical protein